MKPSEKQRDLFSHAFTALCAMRDIDNENPAEWVAGDIALFELQRAMDGNRSLTDDEHEVLAQVIDAWRELADGGSDDDDGQHVATWNDEIEPMIDALPAHKYIESYVADADTLDVVF
jgi:hypothetical protein